MTDLKFEPVQHDHAQFVAQANQRQGFKSAYDALEDEYELIHQLLAARAKAGLTQDAVAERMGTTKSAVSRLEGAHKHKPSLSTLQRYAQAVGCKLQIKLIPEKA
jgi:DNA-binding XRE family transcriptional regulator